MNPRTLSQIELLAKKVIKSHTTDQPSSNELSLEVSQAIWYQDTFSKKCNSGTVHDTIHAL